MIADHFRASQDRLTYIRSNFIFGDNLKNAVYGRAVQLIIWGRYNHVIGQTGSTPEEVSILCECGRSIQVAPHIVYQLSDWTLSGHNF
jgi:hypothetical protein